ncbi:MULTISPECIES: carboxypeptidase M32 [unclassified Chelatococcus]|jgi:carboxypeptidase Taq|uniref:carboxypeptidase M32 n=1 Tax=unclassified Chelatococcus TaxID=2638111 RepID=UPI001BCBAA1E|nr:MULTISPECIES: carboxypeptidase M32 [unclassified Chelatococcus]CAH1660028.1 Metal-dependent carboxypeptidase [Hyphomicrobiales bacterium]MBS7741032.1 carboxypeptidase M32 [Chelatococcus sp. HY11]MBX3545218.1 carboxypeptidase M32 [Chelatococcus sp.]MCO5077851.1 carboxypeptidase M32 [Chelatococcus sp.]CAH1683602.1 Metal-dependent carboxypeptidase [Hyphomicrobiales bacterium]
MTAYSELYAHFGRVAALANAVGILQWDNDTMMPRGAAVTRAESMALLHVLRHGMMTDPRIGDWLEAAAADTGLGAWEKANLREIRRVWTVETAVPPDLVEASSKAISACEMTWRQARADSDFKALLPTLTEVLNLQRAIGEAKGAKLGLSAYDALLNDYEPGGHSTAIDALFDDLADFLPGLTAEVLEVQARRPADPPLAGPFPVAAQRALGMQMMEVLGYDFERGRLDVSTHPFCGGADNDVRITTRYDEDDFTSALMGVIHETGHALYEQGRPQAELGQPVSVARGMSIHESQSLLMEMQACRSREFLRFAAPVMRKAMGGSGPAWEADALWRRYTHVERGFIRVDADEITYPAHVILRYRLEKALVADAMPLAELPLAWNAGMRDLLGVTPPNDRLGCLQDVHWPSGGWGYFPTYTLGAMTAAQLFDAACKANPDVLPAIGRGDFAPLVNWLRSNIHIYGSFYETNDLLTHATGRPLDASVFKAHLRRRYIEEV